MNHQMTVTTATAQVPVRAAAGQSTQIEQSRAVAEVQAAAVMARANPRDEMEARRRILEACQRLGLAQRAFYSYSRGGENVSDASIHLAREMARAWGNIQYEIVELSRDSEAGESECMAYAWDLEANTRPATRFIVPHFRHTRNGARRLNDPRDIYEMIANMGARRVREMIFAALPADLVDDAKDACHQTLRQGDGKPLIEQRKKMIDAFNTIGVTPKMLADHIGRPSEQLTEADLASLRVVYGTLKRGEATVNEIFAGNSTAEPPVKKAKAPPASTPGAAKDAPPNPDELHAEIAARLASANEEGRGEIVEAYAAAVEKVVAAFPAEAARFSALMEGEG